MCGLGCGGGGRWWWVFIYLYYYLIIILLVFVDSVTTPRCGGVEDQTV